MAAKLPCTNITDQRKYYSMVEPEKAVLHGKTTCEIEQLIERLRILSESTTSDAETAEIYSLIYRLNTEKNEAQRLRSPLNSFSGLCERLSIPEILPPPASCIGSTATDIPEISAVFYNINEQSEDLSGYEEGCAERPPIRTDLKNRKHASHKKTMIHNGHEWRINSRPNSGVYTSIMHKWLNELEWYQEKYRRVLVVVFQLHHTGYYYPDNSRITAFYVELKKEVLKYCKKTGRNTQEIGFFWRLEYGKTGAQHYHGGVLVDGNAARKAHEIKKLIDAAWEKVNDVPVHVYYSKKEFKKDGLDYSGMHEYYLDLNKANMDHLKKRLIYHMSYFAKESPECHRAAQVKDSNQSRNSNKPINVRGRKAA